jgi:hypothetical protein
MASLKLSQIPDPGLRAVIAFLENNSQLAQLHCGAKLTLNGSTSCCMRSQSDKLVGAYEKILSTTFRKRHD